jgi:hypothetical protein
MAPGFCCRFACRADKALQGGHQASTLQPYRPKNYTLSLGAGLQPVLLLVNHDIAGIGTPNGRG